MQRASLFRSILTSLMLLALATAACNLPSAAGPPTESADSVQTAAAQTVQAVLNATEPVASPTTAPVSPPTTIVVTVVTVVPGNTPTPVPPTSATPCNQASFIADITIPDGSQMAPGEAFTKTWRLKNTGTCSWTTQYALVFDSGTQMGGPVVQQLTQVVNPGETVDLSVNLVAPAADGTYRGYWRLRDANGNTFGLTNGNAFWVDIKVASASPTSTPIVIIPPPTIIPTVPFVIPPGTTTVTLQSGGAVKSNGSLIGFPNVGDTSDNLGAQAFVTFDLSAIPAGSTISQVKVNFSNYDTLGDPFGELGCLRLYGQNYGTLDAGDYWNASAVNALERWCNTSELSSEVNGSALLISYLETYLGSQAQFRLQFKDLETNNNNVADMVRFGNNIKFIITYTAP